MNENDLMVSLKKRGWAESKWGSVRDHYFDGMVHSYYGMMHSINGSPWEKKVYTRYRRLVELINMVIFQIQYRGLDRW